MACSGRRSIIVKVVIDIIFYLTVSSGVVLSHWFMVKRGFFCSDGTIRYPFKEEMTVPTSLLFSVGLGTPLPLILILEFIHSWIKAKRLDALTTAKQLGKVYGIYLFGWSLNMCITAVIKNVTGRLRPHFIDVCQPNWTNIDCSAGYITDFTCTNRNVSAVYVYVSSRTSFPSGHASAAAFGCMFLALYLQSRLHRLREVTTFLLPVVHCVLAMIAVFVAASRVTDHWHHPSDVVCGALVGLLVAMFLAKTHCSELGFKTLMGETHPKASLVELQAMDSLLDKPRNGDV